MRPRVLVKIGAVKKQRYTEHTACVAIDTSEDIDVAWARRQETLRGVLKLFRVMVSSTQQHAQLVRRQCGISATQLWLLWELDRAPGLRILDLARLLAMHVGLVQEMVEALEARGLARRMAGDGAPKSHRWAVAEAGRQLLADTSLPARGVTALALDTLDDSALQALADGLQPLVGALPFKDGGAALTPLSDLLGDPTDS